MRQAGSFNPAFGAEGFGLKDLKSPQFRSPASRRGCDPARRGAGRERRRKPIGGSNPPSPPFNKGALEAAAHLKRAARMISNYNLLNQHPTVLSGYMSVRISLAAFVFAIVASSYPVVAAAQNSPKQIVEALYKPYLADPHAEKTGETSALDLILPYASKSLRSAATLIVILSLMDKIGIYLTLPFKKKRRISYR